MLHLCIYFRAIINRLNFTREGFFINPSLDIAALGIIDHWRQETIKNETYVIDCSTKYPLFFLAFGWVSNSNLKGFQIDIEPVQPDWKASMNNLGNIFGDHNMADYQWSNVPPPSFSSVRFGAPQDNTYQGINLDYHMKIYSLILILSRRYDNTIS